LKYLSVGTKLQHPGQNVVTGYYLVIVIKLKTYNVYWLQKWVRPFMRCDLEEDE
jgi:hypothetical protein